MTSSKTENTAKAPPTSNPLDVVPDQIPFDVPYGPPISLGVAEAVIHAAEVVSPSVVYIEVTHAPAVGRNAPTPARPLRPGPHSTGSGFIFTPDGKPYRQHEVDLIRALTSATNGPAKSTPPQ